MDCIGTKAFARVRVGIGRPVSRERDAVAAFVLGHFEAAELAQLRAGPLEEGARAALAAVGPVARAADSDSRDDSEAGGGGAKGSKRSDKRDRGAAGSSGKEKKGSAA